MKNILLLSLLFCAFAGKGQEARLVLPVGHTTWLSSAVFSPDEKLVLTSSEDKTARVFELNSGKELQVFSGHKESVNTAVFSPDGKLALTASEDGTARIYEVSTGKELQVLMGHSAYVNTAVFSPDGKLALTASEDGTARIYEVSTGKELQVLMGHSAYINTAVFSPNGNLVLTAGDKTARIYEVTTGKELIILKGHTKVINTAIFSPDGKLVLTSSDDQTARIYETSTGKELQILKGHTRSLSSAVFSPDGSLVLTGSSDKTARIFEVATGKELQVLTGHSSAIVFAVFSPDAKLVITSNYNKAHVYELATGKKIKVLTGHKDWIRTAKFSKDSKLILTSSNDITARIFELASGKELQILNGYTDMVKSAIYSPDSKSALTVTLNNFANIIDIYNGKKILDLSGPSNYATTAVFSHDAEFVITSSYEYARIFELSSGKELQVLEGHTASLTSAKFSYDDKLVLTTSFDTSARIFDVVTGKQLQVLRGHRDFIGTAVFSSDDKFVLTTSYDSTARIYEVSTGKVLHVLKGHTQFLSSGIFSPDNKLVLTTGFDSLARIYEVSSGKELWVLKNHKGGINTGRFSPDGKMILTGSEDSTARIYDVASGKELQVFGGHSTPVRSAIFSPDGKLVLTTCEDNIIRVFEVTSGKEQIALKGHDGMFNFAVFSPDGKNVLGSDINHKTILWNLASGKALYTRLQLKNGDWLVYDEHYRYDGSQGARDYLYFVCGLEVVDLAQVKDALFVPNLVQRIMNGENLDHLPKLKDLEICGVTPEVEQIDQNDSAYIYKIKARKGGVGLVEIYINGMLRQTVDSKSLAQKDGIYELKVDEKLYGQYQIAGIENKIEVIAKVADNKLSSRAAIAKVVSKTEEKKYRKPNLHAIMIGIDDYKGEGLDLNYAAKDATDLQTALKISTQKLFNVDDTNRVHFYPLTLDRAGKISGLTPDRNNILQTIDKIAKSSKPEDVLLLFFAGHGEVNKDRNFTLLSAEASTEEAPNFSGISMKELLDKLATVPAGKRVLILDACHSGAAINDLNLKDIASSRNSEDAEKQSQRLKELENLASKSGLAIITASSSEQKAIEMPQYEHGIMTYALLSTMLNDPEVLDKDNNLQLEDWLRQTEKNVSKLIENQSAQRFVPINFSLGKVDEEVRKSIVLQEIPTIVVANVLNRNTDDDDLDLKTQLIKKLNEISTRGGTDKILIVKEETPNAISVNLSYELSEGKIKSKITLKKDKKVFKQFNFEGNAADLNLYVNELCKELTKNIK